MNRKRMTAPILVWSSEWPVEFSPVDLSIVRKQQAYLLKETMKEDISSDLATAVYDKRESLLNTKHQEITKIPHEIRGEKIKKLKGRGFFRTISSKLLEPVDTDLECCKIIANFCHQQQTQMCLG